MLVSNVNRGYIFDMIEQFDEEFSKKNKLDIGSGNAKSNMMTLDKNIDADADYRGDIRTQFAPVYIENRKKYKNLMSIRKCYFKFIKMQHIVEHVEWIYQNPMFTWVSGLLTNDGVLFIETPNLEWILDTYTKYRDNTKEFPLYNQHPDIDQDDPNAVIKWLNFKLYSGCSTNKFIDGCTDGDFHLCMYTPELLISNLHEAGFVKVEISSDDTISCLAYKE